jgi:predicted transcriptional regulator
VRNATPAGDRTRESIMAVLRERRGVHKSELCRLVDKGWGGMGGHIRRLSKAEAIEVEEHAGFTWIFIAGLTPAEKEFIVATRPTTARRILEAIGLKERATIRTLSDELAVSKKVIRAHLSILERVNAIKKVDGHPPAFAPLQKK